MEIYENLRYERSPSAVALGYFDGVHIGHEKVIRKAVSYKNYGLKPIALTFKESPREALQGTKEIKLTDREKKIKIFEGLGVAALYMIDFNEIKDMSAESFVQIVLSDTLNVKKAVCGFNYTFGVGGTANAETLKILGYKNNISVDVIEAVKYKNEVVSSTRIRKAISENEIYEVKSMTNNL